MSTGNPNHNVGGTAQDGGLSTADTVKDGGPDGGNRPQDTSFVPDQDVSGTSKPQTRSQTGDVSKDIIETVKQ